MTAAKKAKHDLPLQSDVEIIALVDGLQSCSLPYENWTHRAHLAVALFYLRTLPFEQALRRTREGILRYNLSRGDTEGYHETLTQFFVRFIHQFLSVRPAQSLSECLLELSERCTMTILEEYYTRECLWSAQARESWVEPDRIGRITPFHPAESSPPAPPTQR